MAHSHEKITYGIDEVKELFDASVLTGTIVSVDTDNDKAHVNISGFGQINDVPIFYHCEGANTTEGGSSAFSDGDNVYILNKEGKASPSASDLQIVGFVDGLHSCGWTEEWGETICKNHNWTYRSCRHGYIECPVLPYEEIVPGWEDIYCKLSLADGILYLQSERYYEHGTTQYTELWWEYSAMDVVKAPKVLKIKISTSGSVLPNVDDELAMNFSYGGAGEEIRLLFAGDLADPDYVGDNGGEEMSFDLTEWGFSGDIYYMELYTALAQKGSIAKYSLDYIKFS